MGDYGCNDNKQAICEKLAYHDFVLPPSSNSNSYRRVYGQTTLPLCSGEQVSAQTLLVCVTRCAVTPQCVGVDYDVQGVLSSTLLTLDISCNVNGFMPSGKLFLNKLLDNLDTC